MKVVYHPAVQKDVNGILRHYDWISSALGDEFGLVVRRCLHFLKHVPMENGN